MCRAAGLYGSKVAGLGSTSKNGFGLSLPKTLTVLGFVIDMIARPARAWAANAGACAAALRSGIIPAPGLGLALTYTGTDPTGRREPVLGFLELAERRSTRPDDTFSTLISCCCVDTALLGD